MTWLDMQVSHREVIMRSFSISKKKKKKKKKVGSIYQVKAFGSDNNF